MFQILMVVQPCSPHWYDVLLQWANSSITNLCADIQQALLHNDRSIRSYQRNTVWAISYLYCKISSTEHEEDFYFLWVLYRPLFREQSPSRAAVQTHWNSVFQSGRWNDSGGGVPSGVIEGPWIKLGGGERINKE